MQATMGILVRGNSDVVFHSKTKKNPQSAFHWLHLCVLVTSTFITAGAASATDEIPKPAFPANESSIYPAVTPILESPAPLVSFLPEPATPATSPPDLTLEERLQRIEKTLESYQTQADSTRLERREELAYPVPSPQPQDKPVDLKWSGKLGGQVMADYVNWAHASESLKPQAQDLFHWRRIRLNYDAKGYDVYDMRVQFDIEPDNELSNLITEPYVAIKDIYLGISDLPWNARMRFGNFFVPFSLEQLTPLPSVPFIERSIPTTGIFSPAREVGMAWYLLSEDQNRSISLGMFFDDIPESTKEVIDDNQGLRLSSRVVWLPYYDEYCDGRKLFHVGLGSIYTQDRDSSVRFRTTPGALREVQRVLDTGSLAADSYFVTNAEFAAVFGPLCLHSETYLTHVDRLAAQDVNLYGTFFHASYFLTGEHRRYDRSGNHIHHFGRTTPHHNFSMKPGSRGLGAWEVKARWSTLDFTELTRGQYNDMTVGVNWHWNEHARWSFEWIRAWTDANATVGNSVIGATESDLLAVRMQFTF